jgi:hypothetical protein
VPVGDRRHPLIVVDHLRIAPLHLDNLAEALEAGARRNRALDLLRRGGQIVGDAAEHEHPRRQLHRDVDQILGTAALEHLDALDHLERIADGVAQR